MKKIFLLSKMLSRGSGEGDKSSDQNADVFNLFMIIVLGIGSFAAGMFLTPISTLIIPNQTFATMLAVLGALLCLIRIFPMIINGLFMSKDVEVLLTLPYSPLQLALSNSINIIQTVALYQIAATFPFAIGVLIAQTGNPVNILIMDVLFVIFIPIFVSFFIILLSTLIMKGLKTMANREFQKILGVVLASLLIIAYLVFSLNNNNNSGNNPQLDEIFNVINNFVSFVWIIPVAPMIQDFIFDGNIPNIFYAILIDGALVALAFLALNAFYLPILKQVSNTFGSGKEVTDKSIKESSKKDTVTGAIIKKDLKLIFRDSGFYLNCIILPVVFSLFFTFVFYQFLDKIGMLGAIAESTTHGVSTLVVSATIGLTLGLLISASLTAMSGVPSCSFSREGQSYIFSKQMPIGYKKQIKAKRNVAFVMAVPFGLALIIAFSIFGMVLGIFNWLTPVVAIVVFFAASLFFIDFAILADLKNPNFYATKINKLTQPKVSMQVSGIIIAFLSIFLTMAVLLVQPLSLVSGLEIGLIMAIVYVVIIGIPVAFIVLAIVFENRLKTRGPILFDKI